MDEIHFYHYEQENQTAALASGSVDAIYEVSVDQIELAQSIPGAQLLSVETAQTLCCRMQVDVKPFDDIRVRRAIVKAADNAAIKRLVFGEHGLVANNFHVAPVHPEYFPLPPVVRDVAGARQLLKEAGYDKGIDLNIVVGNNDGPWQQAACEALRDQLKEAGIRLAVTVVPATKFWEIWTKVPFGATSWAHRPLGTMALAQAYRSGASWNESHFSNPEFDLALADAEATLDVSLRKAKMQKVEKILQDAAVVVQPFWRPVFILASGKVHGYKAHPARQMQLYKGLDELNRFMGTLVVRRAAADAADHADGVAAAVCGVRQRPIPQEGGGRRIGRIWRGDPVGQRLPRLAAEEGTESALPGALRTVARAMLLHGELGHSLEKDVAVSTFSSRAWRIPRFSRSSCS